MNSISFRLTIWYALAATITAALFLWVGRFALESSYIAGIDDLNDKELEEIAPRIEANSGSDEEVVASVLEHTEIDASLFFFQIGRNDRSAFFTSSNMARHTFPEAVHGQPRVTIEDEHLGRLRVAEYKVSGYDLHIASSLQGWDTLNAGLVRLASVILVGVFVGSLAIGYLLSRLALNPIANIQKTASRIGAENLSERIAVPNTKDEIARLTVFLNEMFERLEAAVLQAQQFAADASHELKTPLSLVRLRTEELLSRTGDGWPEARSELEGQLEDIERLTRVIDDLLLVSKAEAGVLKMNALERASKEFLEDFAEDARALCEDEGVRFELSLRATPLVSFDDVWMRHTLFNLLSNALKVTPRGGEIALVSDVNSHAWTLELRDSGPGLPASKLIRIFDRFYSEGFDEERNRGTGLGLALCRSIVDLHKGRISARNRSEASGLILRIEIPLKGA
ncbi:ATP-binding protein [Pelagicoccus sp. SDUM812003]|uniref:HAMP domain-containing sensor histidine kinase n=1 Tax=Pelagicoccus sp. SDUM812003 TaxID=3041267 RepID=UPI00280C9290|nr:ATP-binding protein [Pelagicoccus sp. SDUM812003]MDQ8202258.1 ATP-binding protein [Pelagicoccus sp. SDUM812003]